MVENDKNSIVIRRAEQRDIRRIEELLIEICKLHCDGRPDIFKEGSKYSEKELIKLITDKDYLVLVADAGSGVIGYAICLIKKYVNLPVFQNFTVLYVDDLCVDPLSRGKGIGHLLFDEIKNSAVKIGAHSIDLNVWSLNKNAIKFYESLGMKPKSMKMEIVLDK